MNEQERERLLRRLRRATLSVTDLEILGALERGPLSAREISDAVVRMVKEAWAERRGETIEWDTDDEPVGASLLACTEARDVGFKMMPWEIDRRLRSLERRGYVTRIQIDGHRPMLWRRRA
jgi:hypothetical protein